MRPGLLIALLALALLPLSGCGSDAGESGLARDALERASRSQASSADLDLTLEIELDGVEQLKDPVKVGLRGPFRSNGKGQLPDLDWRVGFDAGGRKGELRVITVRDNAFVEYNGTTYEVGEQLVSRFRSQTRAGPPQEEIRRLGIDGSNWLKDGTVEDDGRKISGEVDVRGMLADLNQIIARVPQGRRVPERTIDQIDEAVKDASIEVRVGDDHILRSSRFDLSFELPDELRSRASGLEGGELKLRLEQSNVNGGQSVQAPSGARPITELLRSFGVPPEALLGAGGALQSPG